MNSLDLAKKRGLCLSKLFVVPAAPKNILFIYSHFHPSVVCVPNFEILDFKARSIFPEEL